jgi:hypothetical protein
MSERDANTLPGSPMPAEERAARAVVESFVRAVESRKPWDAVAVIAAAFVGAVAEEREACALEAESYQPFEREVATGRAIAAAIRARGR